MTTCECRCHLGGGHTACTVGPTQPGGNRSCQADPQLVHGATPVGDLDRLCPGPCNRDWHRLTAEEQQDPDQPVRPSIGEPWWCQACQRRIVTAVAELADVYVLLELDKARRTKDQSDRLSGSKAAPSPSPADDAQEALAAELVHLEDVIRHRRRMRPRVPDRAAIALRPLDRTASRLLPLRPGEHGPRRLVTFAVAGSPTGDHRDDVEAATVIRAINLIGRHATWWLTDPALAVDTGKLILNTRNALRAVTKSAAGRVHYDRPCPRCDVRALFQEPGDDIVCDACGTVLRHDEYERGGAFGAAAERARTDDGFLGYGVDIGPEDGYSRGTGVPVLDSDRVRLPGTDVTAAAS